MDSVQWIALGSVIAGFVVGYLLGRWNGRSDVIDDVTMRVAALRKVGKGIAELTDGRVQWSAVEENLRKFPGQEKR